MLDFQTYLRRYGEFGVQAIIEKIERYEGIGASNGFQLDLEQRWQSLMSVSSIQDFITA